MPFAHGCNALPMRFSTTRSLEKELQTNVNAKIEHHYVLPWVLFTRPVLLCSIEDMYMQPLSLCIAV